jgi:hypothetical protein
VAWCIANAGIDPEPYALARRAARKDKAIRSAEELEQAVRRIGGKVKAKLKS